MTTPDAIAPHTQDLNLNSRSASPSGCHPMPRSDSLGSLSSSQKPSARAKKTKDKPAGADAPRTIADAVAAFKTGPTLLRPTRQASKNAVLNIMERNEVVLELIKVKRSQQYIMEVC